MSKKKKTSEPSEPPEPDPDLYFGTGKFEFPNGDFYEGEYCAHRFGILWRQGHGIYTSKENQIYEADWNDDKIVEENYVRITYPNGAKYFGKLAKNKYNGPGEYILENTLRLCCNFINNQPKDDIVLEDHDGILWTGKAEKTSARLLPENIFFSNLDENRGKGKPKFEVPSLKAESSTGETVEDEIIDDRELERMIFAKSKKTLSKLDLLQSKWYQNYMTFLKIRERVMSIIHEEGSSALDEYDMKWFTKYLTYKRKRNEMKKAIQKPGSPNRLIRQYLSEEYRNANEAMRVFRPTSDWYKIDFGSDSEYNEAAGSGNLSGAGGTK